MSEKSVDCGSQKKGHKKTLDLLCQEYVIRTPAVEYHVRQAKDSAKELLPVHSKVEFVLSKDKMKFTLNGKKYEYRIVSEEALEARAEAGSH